jgi:hypothetical protein
MITIAGVCRSCRRFLAAADRHCRRTCPRAITALPRARMTFSALPARITQRLGRRRSCSSGRRGNRRYVPGSRQTARAPSRRALNCAIPEVLRLARDARRLAPRPPMMSTLQRRSVMSGHLKCSLAFACVLVLLPVSEASAHCFVGARSQIPQSQVLVRGQKWQARGSAGQCC